MIGTSNPTGKALLEIESLSVRYPVKRDLPWQPRRLVHAVQDVSFQVARGETLGIVGESGSGKTTLARTVMRRVASQTGRITFDGTDITRIRGRELKDLRSRIQMIFQDPTSSLNPRMNVYQILAEPLRIAGAPRQTVRERVEAMIEMVGMAPSVLSRYPHSFSGGQCQRIGIARSLILEPDLIVADEPVSALDVSVQAEVVNLLLDLQKHLATSYIFIAHDLSVVQHVSQRVLIMYLGRVVESAASDSLFNDPRHPYTQALLSAIPVPDPLVEVGRKRLILRGDPPSPLDPPPGCPFQTRCPYRQPTRCSTEVPVLQDVSEGHAVACHFTEQIRSGSLVPTTAGDQSS